MAKIFIVEDEENIADLVRMNLEIEGHSLSVINSGDEAIDRLAELCSSDLLLLDWMLPGTSGVEITKAVRKTSEVPILILSAKGSTSERIEGLKAGANDYLPKPFDLEELLLRVQNLLPIHKSSTVQIGLLTVDLKSFEVHDEQDVLVQELSKREIGLLELFSENEGSVISREEILDRLWGKEQFPTSRTIDNYILNFRKLFEPNPKEPRYFHSIRGVGYKFTL